jgi:hypothetical protein
MLWDASGPSYLRPLVRRDGDGKPKPGFFVCDVIIGDGETREQAVRAFVRKCQLLGTFKRMGPLLPMLISDRYSREGFGLGRSQGVIMATPGTLFGRDVAAGLAALLHTLTKAAAIAAQRPEAIGELFDKLGAIEGASANLRGALFEMLVGHCVMTGRSTSAKLSLIPTLRSLPRSMFSGSRNTARYGTTNVRLTSRLRSFHAMRPSIGSRTGFPLCTAH